MPSSWAITAAVRGWSPVIISGRMPAPFARATASLASGRGGSIMPIKPGEHQILFDRCVRIRSVLCERPGRQPPAGDTQRPQCLAGERLVDLENLRGDAPRVSGRRPSPTSFLGASCEQHVGRALREHDAAIAVAPCRGEACSSACVRRRTALRRRVAAARPTTADSRPALRAATRSAPSVGSPCTVQRPSRSTTSRVVCSIGDSERTFQFHSECAVDGPPSSR